MRIARTGRIGLVVILGALACGAVAAAATGCGPREARAPELGPRPERVAIARAEAQREDGVAALIALADDADASVRAAALRGLGRVGDAAAVAHLRARVRDGRDAAAAAAALGLAGALDTLEPADAAAITAELVALAGRPGGDGGDDRAIVLDALGRAGDAGALPALAAALAGGDGPVAAAAGIAIGRLGRRGIAPDADAVAAAIARAGDGDPAVRYAAVYALARGHVASADGAAPPHGDAALRALAARLGDDEPEVRALALAGLARRHGRGAAGAAAVTALGDADGRVAVEAARLLAAPGAAAEDARAVAVAAARQWAQVAGGREARAHVVIEALGLLGAHAGDPAVREAIEGIVRSLTDEPPVQRPAEVRLAAAHVLARGLAALGRRAGPEGHGARVRLRQVELPDAVIGALWADAIAAAAADDPALAPELAAAAADGPAARRAAALGKLPAAWASATPDARAAAAAAVVTALEDDDPEPELLGAAAEAAAALLARDDVGGGDRAAIERALGARVAALPDDPELASSLLTAAGAARLAGAEPACRAAHTEPSPAVRAAARACLKAVTGADPGPGRGAPPPPDGVDPRTVVGARVTWSLDTSRGRVLIALDPDAAPWHVATIVTLTRRGFYDGLTFHRVVPGFVVQGGDPAGTGWGGPGFTVPAEPSTRRYDAGVVGIADAGKDTGGSQWFAMHARAPHLEGRYTAIGEVIEGHLAVQALLVGDRIDKARIDVYLRRK